MSTLVKVVAFLVGLLVVMWWRNDFRGSDRVEFASASGRVTLDVPAGWKETEGDHPYDLQVVSRSGRMNTGIFEYYLSNLEAGYTAEELLAFHVDDIGSKREQFTEYAAGRTSDLPDKRLTTRVYSGVRSSSTNLYTFTLVQFRSEPDFVLVAIQVSLPEDWEKSRPMLEEIMASARLAADSAGV